MKCLFNCKSLFVGGMAAVLVFFIYPAHYTQAALLMPQMQTCTPYVTSYTSYGDASFEVQKLQLFLNAYTNSNLPVTGYYGPLTKAAVTRFQNSYGIMPATGNQFEKTSALINALYCRPAQGTSAARYVVVPTTSRDTHPMVVNFPETISTAVINPLIGNQSSSNNLQVTIDDESKDIQSISGVPERTVRDTMHSSQDTPLIEGYGDILDQDTTNARQSIPWLMLAAALLLAYLAARNYRRMQSMPASQAHLPAPARPSGILAAPNVVADVQKSDFTKLEGIGFAAQKVLYTAGVDTYSQLAALNKEDIVTIFKKAWPHFNEPSIATWPEQAAFARDGKWIELDHFVAALKKTTQKS